MSSSIIETQLKGLFELLSRGQFIEAMHKYLHDDVLLYEGNDDVKVGKDVCITFEEEVLSNVAEFVKYEVKGHAINGNTSFYEAVMEYVEKSGNRVIVEQCVVSTWKDGQITQERFYHA